MEIVLKFWVFEPNRTRTIMVNVLREGVMKNMLMAYLRDEDGQTSTEYILLMAVVAAIVFKFREVATDRLSGIIDKVFNKADGMLDNM